MRLSFAAIALLLVALGGAHCWHGPGHYSVAYIAQEYLSRRNPDALKWANDILNPLTEMCGENLYPFVESATWADKISDQQWFVFAGHHFLNIPLYQEGAPENPHFPKAPFADAVFSIGQQISTLTSTKEDPYGSSKSLLGKSIALRLLIHITGDIHQPLHTTTRVTPKLPEGDKGGNLFTIDHYKDESDNNLHFVWDEMFRPIETAFRTNLPPARYREIAKLAEGIMEEHPFESLQPLMAEHQSPQSWALEGHQIAASFAFKGLQEGADLPAEYMKKGLSICRQRVALAGYRLGMAIDKIFMARNTSPATALGNTSPKPFNKMNLFRK